MLYVNGWICWNDICISYRSLTDALLNKNQDLLVVLCKVTILQESSTLDKKHIPLILPNWKKILKHFDLHLNNLWPREWALHLLKLLKPFMLVAREIEKNHISLYSFFFFFFLRNRTLRSYKINSKAKRNYKESLVTRGAISSGMELYQTCSSLPDLELLAKQWATTLPIRFTWEKQQDWKSLAKNRTSWITRPNSWWDESFWRAFIITSASPSTMHCTTPRSLAKSKALRHARSSTIAAD